MISYRQIGKFEYYKHLINILKSKHILTIHFQTGREKITVKYTWFASTVAHTKEPTHFGGKWEKTQHHATYIEELISETKH